MPPDDAPKSPPDPVTPTDAEARGASAPADRDRAISGAPEPLIRKAWFSDWADRLLFLVFFIGGFAIVLGLKLAGVQGLVVAGLAGALLLGYAALAWLVPFLRLHSDRLGDNCYYLGLLYTLASLAAALMQLERAAGAEQRAALIETLLASFGVALISTVIGIALRVFFLQMRREVDDLEEQIRRELNARALDLKDQMLFAVTELESFRLRTQQVLEERLVQSTNAHAEAIKAQTIALGELSARIMAQMDRTFSRHAANAEALDETTRQVMTAGADLAERVRAIEVPRDLVARRVDAMAQRIAKAAERIESGADMLAGRLTSIEVPSDLISAKLSPMIAGFAQTLSQASTAVGQAGSTIAGTEGSIQEAMRQLSVSVVAVANATQSLETLQRAIPATAEAADRLRDALSAQAETIRGIAADSAEDARAVRANRDQLLADLAQSREALGNTQATLVQIIKVITERLGG